MQSGRLNKFIVIEEKRTMTNEYGEEEQTFYTEKIRTRAEVINDSGNRSVDNGEIFYSYNKTFVLWDYYEKVINEFNRIIYQEKAYRIISIDVVKESKLIYVKTELIDE